LYRQRGVDVLSLAFCKMLEDRENIHLILVWHLDNGLKISEVEQIHYLGELDYKLIHDLFNALDLGVICNLNSNF